jgi:DNA polymerase elongation subunit (family B)
MCLVSLNGGTKLNFYTNVFQHKNKILVCGYNDGKRYKQEVNYKPYLFIPTKKDSPYKNIHGEKVDKLPFASIYDAKNFMKQYSDVEGFSVYGLANFQYTYIYDNFRDIKYDTSLIKTCVLDIETDSTDGFPNIALADKQITAITMMYDKITFCLGYGDFETNDISIKYIRCKSEEELLEKFLMIWQSDLFRPDVVTGWNIEFFDIPYIINRCNYILGEGRAAKLSPFNVLEQRRLEINGKEINVFHPVGVSVLDYMHLYKKFVLTPQESYRLDHISNYELGERKLDYSEYESLAELYKNDHQKFMEYNVKDCGLVKRLDEKLKLLDLVYTFAYDSGTNFIDAMTSVRSWDIIIHNYLMSKKIVIPYKKRPSTTNKVAGAYVKKPLTGMYDWVVSFDLTSLYPHLIMSYNISPDTIKGVLPVQLSINQILDGKVDNIKDFLEEKNLSLAGSCCYFTKNKQGFLADLMEQLFSQRKEYKDKMLEAKKQYERTEDPKLKFDIAKYNNLQLAAKVKLNSAYGALGNAYFRWYDRRLAESITLSGQLTIRWAEEKINKYLNDMLATDNVDYVIASDTDSVYINMSGVVNKSGLKGRDEITNYLDNLCENEIQKYLNSIFNELGDYMNCYKKVLHMKRESISDRGVFVAKKRYILNVLNNEGIQYKEPELKVMGIEAVRSSTPQACRDAIKELMKIILTKTEADTIAYIDSFRRKFKTLPFEEVSFPRGMNGLSSYQDSVKLYKKGTPIHVRGAIMYNYFLKKKGLDKKYTPIFDKDKVKFCYLKLPNPLRENVISVPQMLPKQMELDKYIDYDTQFDKSFLEPIKTILDIIGWHTEKKITLRSLFE